MEIYVVKPGDTVDFIAESHGISVSSVIYNNQLVYPYPLAVGQALLLSSGETDPTFLSGLGKWLCLSPYSTERFK